jgi:predicted permease
MPVWPSDGLTALSRAVLRVIGRLTPRAARDEWLAEWEGELWQLRSRRSGGLSLVLFLAGALWHGVWEWKEGWRLELSMQDIRYAFRTLRRSPGFAVAAVAILALSIGANTAMFSVVENTILDAPPYPEPERLVSVDLLFGQDDGPMRPNRWSYPRFRALREHVAGLTDAAGYGARTVTLTDLGPPRVVSIEAVSPGIFELLGVRSSRGRLLGAQEIDNGDPILSAVVSEEFWRNDLGATPNAVGSLITLDGSRFQVLGVVADGFRGVTGRAELWIPFAALRAIQNDGMLDDAWNLHFQVLARLGEGVSFETAQAQVRAFGATQSLRYPAPVAAQRFRISADILRLADARVNPVARESMIALFGAVVLMLLVATTNLAGLMLARGANRQREAAIRASLGAGRARLLRQLLTESLTLALVGGLLGVCLAWLGVDVLGSRLADAIGTEGGRGLMYLDTTALSIDWAVLGFALATTGGVGLGLGVLPALQLARTPPNAALKGGAMTGGVLHRIQGAAGRNGMLVVQIAVAMVLLVGASLMMRSLAAMQRTDLGFEPENLLTAVYTITPADEDAGLDPGTLHVDFAERLRALPGVTGVALGTVPMGGPRWTTIVTGSDGDAELEESSHTWMQLQPVDEGNLAVLSVELIEGRDIERADDRDSDRVIVLNQVAARQLFPEGNAIGRRLRLGWPGYGYPGATVVGVAGDVQLASPGTEIPLQAYISVRQSPQLATGVMVRATGDPLDLVPAVRSSLAEVAGNIPLTSVMTMDERAIALTARSRAVTTILGLFGAGALILVAVGLYGMIAFMVARRTREIGLRASLGADRASLATLVLKQGLTVTAIGIGVGLAASAVATRYLESLLFDTPRLDPAAMAGMAIVLFAVSMAASYVPARRAMRVDPMVALRAE